MKTKRRVNYRVEARPLHPGEFDFGLITGIGWTEDEEKRACEAAS